MIQSDFLELSQLFGTGMTGSTIIRDRYGNTVPLDSRLQFQHAWTFQVIILKSLEQSGLLKPYSSISIWQTMSLGSFSPIVLTSLGQEVYLNSMTLSELTSVTQLETSLKVWLWLFSLEMMNQLLCQYLTRTFLTPYWMSEPYSGSGKIIHDSRTNGHSPASITLHPHAPKIYYMHYEILQPLSTCDTFLD